MYEGRKSIVARVGRIGLMQVNGHRVDPGLADVDVHQIRQHARG